MKVWKVFTIRSQEELGQGYFICGCLFCFLVHLCCYFVDQLCQIQVVQIRLWSPFRVQYLLSPQSLSGSRVNLTGPVSVDPLHSHWLQMEKWGPLPIVDERRAGFQGVRCGNGEDMIDISSETIGRQATIQAVCHIQKYRSQSPVCSSEVLKN